MDHTDGTSAAGVPHHPLRRPAHARGGALLALLIAMLALPLTASPRATPADPSPPRSPLPETPQFRRIGMAEGLPSSRVNALGQDRDGYLWIATDDGLVRYDGASFRTWRADPGIVGGMPGNSVQTLFIDRDDTVWMGFDDGQLATIDDRRRSVRPLPPLPGNEGSVVWAMAQTRDGRLWASTFGEGLYRTNAAGGFESLGPVPSGASGRPQSAVFGMAEDADGTLWIGTMAGLARYVDGRLEPVAAGPIDDFPVLWVSADPDGTLWIGTRGGGLWQRHGDGRFLPAPWADALGAIRVHGILRDGRGGRWLQTQRGLFFADADGLRRFQVPEAAEGDYQQGLIDHQGGLWFGDAEFGLVWLSGDWRSFSTLSRGGAADYRLSIRQALAFAPLADGSVLLGGEDGRVDRLRADGRRIETQVLPADVIGPGRVFALRETRDGSLWVGSGHLSRRDPAGRWQTWRATDADPVLPGPVDHLLPLPDGSLWLASYGGGLQHRDADGRVLRNVRPGDGLGLEEGTVESLLLGPDGQPWIGNDQGVLRWDGGRLVPLAPPRGRSVEGMAFDAEGMLWTWSSGVLTRYAWANGTLAMVDEATPGNEELPAAEAGGIVVDRGGRVWIPSVRGLYRYDPIARSARRFGAADGLSEREFGLRPPLKLADGRIVAGAIGGAVLFDPMRVEPDARTPPLVIESASVRRAEDLVELDPEAPLTLHPDDRELRVVARLMAFAEPSSTRYRFRLNGYDPDWVDVGAAGERPLPRPSPGRYTLDVIGAGADGRWTPPVTLQVVVLPPWYATWWALGAYALAAALLAAAVLLLFRNRLRAQAERRRDVELRALAQQASDAKTAFLADLGHELRTPLTGVLGMAELLLRDPLPAAQRERVETVQRAGQHLLRLVNDTLDLARIEAGRLTLDDAPFSPRSLLSDVALLLRPLAEAKGLAFELRIEPGLPPTLRGDEARLRQILLNLGGNAIKFTERGRVALSATPRPGGGLRLTVEDTGIGLDEAQQARLFQRFSQAEGDATRRRFGGTGLGLAISRELARAMGGELGLASRKGEGSTFTIDLPLPEADVTLAPAPAALPTPRVADAPPAASMSLLLVEDDPIVAEVMRGLLEARGHRVHHAAQALQALTLLQTERIDLALLDLDLPAVDGFELAQLIRGNGWTLPLVAVTARADAASERRAVAAGMDAYLRKPVDGDTLATTIDALAHRRA